MRKRLAQSSFRVELFRFIQNGRFRTINAAIAEGANHRLTISSDLGEPVPLTTKVHFLTAVRADADRVEIRHDAVVSEVTLPVVEVME
jgi:hypothetical protein